MLSSLPFGQLLKLQQDDNADTTDTTDAADTTDTTEKSSTACTYTLCNLMESFDSQPKDAGDEDSNKTMGMIGILLTSLGLSAGVSAGFFSSTGYSWDSYVSWGLAGLGYFTNFYGWWMYIQSVGTNADAWDAFSSWRWNWLASMVAALVLIWNVLDSFLWYFSYTLVWGSSLGGLVLVGAGAYFVHQYVQDYWWNMDANGDMQNDDSWDWFADEPTSDTTTTTTTETTTTTTEYTTYY